MKQKRLVALLLVLAMLFAVVTVIAACDKHECKHVCETCGKCTDATCTDPACKDKCPGHETAHVCGHKCPTCGKCTDNTCTDPVCADKCQGHEVAPSKEGVFTPITQPVAGQYYMGMKCIGDAYYYLKGGMANFYMATSNNQEDAVVVTLIADGDGWLLKQGDKYMEIEISGTHINAVFKDAQTENKHWSWDETYKIFTWENGTYFYGTYGNYNTIGGANYAQHASDNYKAQLGLFVPVTVGEVESVSIMNGIDYANSTAYLLPIEGNSISFSAKVNPSNAPQDIVWSVTNGDVATVTANDTTEEAPASAQVIYKGQTGSVTLTATAKGTNISATVTVEFRDVHGGKESDPLTVDEAIAIMEAKPGEYLNADDRGHGYYIQGTVASGSTIAGSGTWSFTLAGTDNKSIDCSVEGSKLNGIKIPNMAGGLDGCQILLYAERITYVNDAHTAKGNTNELKSCTFPALTAIEIEAEQTEVTIPNSVEITVKSITPANAVFENVEWLTSDETKATVTGDESKATVTAVAAGEVKISVRCANITSNEITLTISEEQTAVKVIYDWTSALEGKVCDSTLYSQRDPREMITEINQWTPGQQEIKSFVTEGTMYDSIEAPGIAYIPAKRLIAGQITIQTLHEIKKVTFKVVPFADATTTQLSVNTISKTHEKGDSVYTGDPSSAIDIVFELTEATTTLNVEATGVAGNSFAIVGITLEW